MDVARAASTSTQILCLSFPFNAVQCQKFTAGLAVPLHPAVASKCPHHRPHSSPRDPIEIVKYLSHSEAPGALTANRLCVRVSRVVVGDFSIGLTFLLAIQARPLLLAIMTALGEGAGMRGGRAGHSHPSVQTFLFFRLNRCLWRPSVAGHHSCKPKSSHLETCWPQLDCSRLMDSQNCCLLDGVYMRLKCACKVERVHSGEETRTIRHHGTVVFDRDAYLLPRCNGSKVYLNRWPKYDLNSFCTSYAPLLTTSGRQLHANAGDAI